MYLYISKTIKAAVYWLSSKKGEAYSYNGLKGLKMNRDQYQHLPKHIKARTEEYLTAAKSVSEEWFGMDNGNEIHLLSVQLAAAMMNMDSAEVIASEIASFAEQLKKHAA